MSDSSAVLEDRIVEHHNPVGRKDYLSKQHVERYRFAASLLESREKVLDVASGAGYGTAILLERGCRVTGADCDDELVSAARRRWHHEGFVTADALDLPFDDGSFDAVVTFETIEHVRDGRAFLAEMKRVLRPGGRLMCSTPNIAYTAHPPFHLREYRPEEFFQLVREEFGETERHAQYFHPWDRLRDLYHWHVRWRLVTALEKIGAKEFLKRVLKRGSPVRGIGDAAGAGGDRGDVVRLLQGPARGPYRVRPYRGDKRLRIMVAVARKEGLT